MNEKEKIKFSYYKAKVKSILKKLDGTMHSEGHIEKLIANEPAIVKEVIIELLNEKKYFSR